VSEDKFGAAAERTLKFEGGYSNHPTDRGGETNRGITIATARRGGYTGDMKELTENDALDIYERLYWSPLHLDNIDDAGLRLVMFDSGVHMGLSWPALWLQEALNDQSNNGSRWKQIIEDGLMGPVTAVTANIATVTPGSASAIKEAILNARLMRFAHIVRRDPSQTKWHTGWNNRVARLRTMIQHPDMKVAKKEESPNGPTTRAPESTKEA